MINFMLNLLIRRECCSCFFLFRLSDKRQLFTVDICASTLYACIDEKERRESINILNKIEFLFVSIPSYGSTSLSRVNNQLPLNAIKFR